MQSVCVFLGSNTGYRPEFEAATRQLAREIARRGLTLVYGGAGVGCMAALADEALAAGGKVTGVIPKALKDKEVAHKTLSHLEIVADMAERKTRMAELSDAFITLPGGLGTMDEFFEALTWAQIGLIKKPSAILDVLGHHSHLLAYLDTCVRNGFVHPAHRDMILVDTDPAALLTRLADSPPPMISKWIAPVDPVTSALTADRPLRSYNERELTSLTGMSQLLHTCLSESDVLDVAGEYLPVLFPDATGALYLRGENDALEPALNWGSPKVAGPLPGNRCSAILRNLPRDSMDGGCHDSDCPIAETTAHTPGLCIPLADGEQRLGLMALTAPAGLKGRSGLAVVAAENVALTLSNLRLKARLQEMSVRDQLTGFYNRRHLADILARREKKDGAPALGVVLFDLDHFKVLNDTHGHLAGDEALRAVGRHMLSMLDDGETIFRYGGEEFLLLIDGGDLNRSASRAEEYRVAVQELVLNHDGRRLRRVTISAGAAAVPEGGNAEAGIAAADVAMYRAKKAGRNQVARAED